MKPCHEDHIFFIITKLYFSFLGINDQIGRHLRDENKIRYKLKLMKVLEPSGTR